MSKRKVFSREFKLEALRALDAGQKQATELARELGVPRSRLYAWRAQLQGKDAEDAFPGHGRRSGPEAELAAIKAENARLREENDILKKAARYFGKRSIDRILPRCWRYVQAPRHCG